MTDQELRTRVQKAVDHKLSGIQDDPWLARRVMNRVEEEKPVMKKKLSISLVFVLVGILLLARRWPSRSIRISSAMSSATKPGRMWKSIPKPLTTARAEPIRWCFPGGNSSPWTP